MHAHHAGTGEGAGTCLPRRRSPRLPVGAAAMVSVVSLLCLISKPANGPARGLWGAKTATWRLAKPVLKAKCVIRGLAGNGARLRLPLWQSRDSCGLGNGPERQPVAWSRALRCLDGVPTRN